MLFDQPQQKYRVCYSKLLRLYPKAYRDRFAPEMDQTFSDLCRERLKSGEGLFVLALETFIETFAAILRENLDLIVHVDFVPNVKFRVRVVMLRSQLRYAARSRL